MSPAPKDFKPLLAGKAPEDLSTLTFPVLVSPKLDGIRCVIRNGQAVSRKLKRIPNRYIQRELCGLPDGLDGELMVVNKDEDGFALFNEVQSFVMSQDTEEAPFWFFVFDWDTRAQEPQTFEQRLAQAALWSEGAGNNNVMVLEHVECNSAEEVEKCLTMYLNQGFEGAMVRDPKGPYKYGRSTTKQGTLLKLKLFEDEEAEIIGVEEQMHNDNEKKKDELGHAKRSTHKENMRPAGTLGKLVLRFPDGAEFRCGGGPGLTAALRQDMWYGRENLIGQIATIKHQPDPGGRRKGQAPRIPQLLGIRLD